MKNLYIFLLFVLFAMISCENEAIQKNEIPGHNDIVTDQNKTYIDSIFIEKEEKDSIIQEQIVKLDQPLRAFIVDDSPTNIRKSPGGEVIMQLPENDDYIIHIVAKSGRWFQIESIDAFDSDTLLTFPDNTGWLHGSVIGFDTRNYGGQKITLYAEADAGSNMITTINHESSVRLIDIEGKWVKIEYTDNNGVRFEGWIDREWLCGNPVTNCC